MTWKLTTTSHRAVGQRQFRQIAVMHLHPRVPRPDVGDRRLVIVQPDHTARDAGDQVGAVALAEAGFEHVATSAAVGQPLVDDLVAAEPVVLLVEAGKVRSPVSGSTASAQRDRR